MIPSRPTLTDQFIRQLDESINDQASIKRLEEECLQSIRWNEKEALMPCLEKMISLIEKVNDGYWSLVSVAVATVGFSKNPSDLPLEFAHRMKTLWLPSLARRCIKEMCCEAFSMNRKNVLQALLDHPMMEDGLLKQMGVDLALSESSYEGDVDRVFLVRELLERINDKSGFIQQLRTIYPKNKKLDELLPVLMSFDPSSCEGIIEDLSSLDDPPPFVRMLKEKQCLEEAVSDALISPTSSSPVPRPKKL